MWKELLATADRGVRFNASASEGAIAEAEAALAVRLPDDLRGLLRESNGVQDRFGGDLIWSTSRLITDNIAFRTTPGFAELYMPFDPLLFFSDDGSGNQFSYVVTAGKVRRRDIFEWDHENDSRTWVAPRLERFLTERLSALRST